MSTGNAARPRLRASGECFIGERDPRRTARESPERSKMVTATGRLYSQICRQIFGRKIQNLIKFKSLIGIHSSQTNNKFNDSGGFAHQANIIDRWNIACTYERCLFKQDVLHLQRGGRIQVSEDCKRSWKLRKPPLEIANDPISFGATSSHTSRTLRKRQSPPLRTLRP